MRIIIFKIFISKIVPGKIDKNANFFLIFFNFYQKWILYWKGFPYLSDTGAYPPESCVFSQFLVIAAFLCKFFCIFKWILFMTMLQFSVFILMYARYKQIKMIILMEEGNDYLNKFNKFCYLCGIVSCFGFTLVACYQVILFLLS